MSGSARFEREVRLSFGADALWDDIRREVAAEARQTRDRLIAGGQFARTYRTIVNGVEGALEETIRRDGGAIVYQSLLLGPAVLFALDFLQRRSPSRSGRYRDSFIVAIGRGAEGGRPIPMAAFRAGAVSEDATTAIIYSPLPYSRKLDVQLIGGRSLRFNAPPGLYADAVKAIRSAFPNMEARRLYTVRHPTAQKRQDGKRIEYPALEIEVT